MKYEPSFIAVKNFSSIKFFVSLLSATCTLTTSEADATSSGDCFISIPSFSARSGVSDRLQATTGIPNARARVIISCPIRPTPISPSVRPKMPGALLYSFLFHRPCLRSLTLSGIRLSSESINPNANSATAIEFLPGQLVT